MRKTENSPSVKDFIEQVKDDKHLVAKLVTDRLLYVGLSQEHAGILNQATFKNLPWFEAKLKNKFPKHYRNFCQYNSSDKKKIARCFSKSLSAGFSNFSDLEILNLAFIDEGISLGPLQEPPEKFFNRIYQRYSQEILGLELKRGDVYYGFNKSWNKLKEEWEEYYRHNQRPGKISATPVAFLILIYIVLKNFYELRNEISVNNSSELVAILATALIVIGISYFFWSAIARYLYPDQEYVQSIKEKSLAAGLDFEVKLILVEEKAPSKTVSSQSTTSSNNFHYQLVKVPFAEAKKTESPIPPASERKEEKPTAFEKKEEERSCKWTPRLTTEDLSSDIAINLGKFGYYRPKQAMRQPDVIKVLEHKNAKHYVLFTSKLLDRLKEYSVNNRNLYEQCEQYIMDPRIVPPDNHAGLVRCDDQLFGKRRCYFKLKISGTPRILSTPYEIWDNNKFMGYLHHFDENDIDLDHNPRTTEEPLEFEIYDVGSSAGLSYNSSI